MTGPTASSSATARLDALLIDDVQALEGKEQHPGGVRSHLQRPPRRRQADRSLERPPAGGDRAARGAAPRPLRMGPVRRARATRPANPDRARVDGWPREARLELPDPTALREIAALVLGNVRRLEGAMTTGGRCFVHAREADNADARRTKPSTARSRPTSAPTPIDPPKMHPASNPIQEAVCSTLGVARNELLSPNRTARVTQARTSPCTSRETDVSFPRPDRPRLPPRPQHRDPCHTHRVEATRSRIRLV